MKPAVVNAHAKSLSRRRAAAVPLHHVDDTVQAGDAVHIRFQYEPGGSIESVQSSLQAAL